MNRRDFFKALPLLPVAARADLPLALCGVIILGIGCVVVIELHSLCKKAFPPPPTPPPPPPTPCECGSPNCTCATPQGLQKPVVTLKLTDDNINCFDVSGLGYVDPKSGAPILTWFSTTLMKSDDCRLWWHEVIIQGWYSQSGITLTLTGPTVFPTDTYLPLGGTLRLPINLGDGGEPAQFFKLL